MPYFLVSHKSLIEADDERAAAEAAMLALQRAGKITFSVTVDQDVVRQVVLDPSPRQTPEEPGDESINADQEWGLTQARSASVGSAQDRPAKMANAGRIFGQGGLLFTAGLIVGLALASF